MAAGKCLVNNILYDVFLCFEQKKETRTGLKRLQGKWMMPELKFLDELFLTGYIYSLIMQLFNNWFTFVSFQTCMPFFLLFFFKYMLDTVFYIMNMHLALEL